MKKLWRTAGALAVSAAFAFSAVACTDGESSISSAGGDSTSGGSSGTQTGILSTGYITKALEQFSSAKSLKVSLDGEVSLKLGGALKADGTAQFHGDVVVSETETGADMGIVLTGTVTNNADTESEPEQISASMYLIDGYMYMYNEEYEFYEMSSVSFDSESFMGMLMEYLSMADIEGMLENIDMDAVVAELAQLLDEKGTVTENSASLSLAYDAKDTLNNVISLIKEVKEGETLEGALDVLLAAVSPELTTEGILDMIKPLGTMTLKDICVLFDGMLTQYETSLTDLKNAVFANIPEETLAGLVEAGILTQEMLNMLKTDTVENILAAFEVSEMTVNELIGMLMGAGDEEDSWTEFYSTETGTSSFDLAEVIENQIKPFLKNTTLEEIGIMIPELDGVSVSKAELGAELVIGNTAIEKMEMSCDFAVKQEPKEENGNSSMDLTAKITLNVEDISSSPVKVGLPENATTVWAVWNEEWFGYTDSEYEASISFYPPMLFSEEIGLVYSGIITVSDWTTGCSTEYEFVYTPLADPSEAKVSITVVSGTTWTSTGSGATLTEEELAALFGDSLATDIQLIFGTVDLSAFPVYEETVA